MESYQFQFDVIIEILAWLPVKTLLRFSSVCKEWYNLINGPFFSKLHLKKSLLSNSQRNRSLVCSQTFYHLKDLYILDDFYHPSKVSHLNWPEDTLTHSDIQTKRVGFCNGLLCLAVTAWEDGITQLMTSDYYTVSRFIICNPSTRTFKSITIPSSNKPWFWRGLSYGFGYDSRHDDYKIVVTSNVRIGSDVSDVRVYSSKADIWNLPVTPTRTQKKPYGRRGKVRAFRAIYGNNMLYHLVSDAGLREYKIASFDLCSEQWRNDLSFPVVLTSGSRVHLGALDGCIYLRIAESNKRPCSTNVWILGGENSWSKLINLPPELSDYVLISRSKEGHPGHPRLLFQKRSGHGCLRWYNQQDHTSLLYMVKGFTGDTCAELHIASLAAIPGSSSQKMPLIREFHYRETRVANE